jgi:hypothetical protein
VVKWFMFLSGVWVVKWFMFLSEVWVTGYNFESWPFKNHSCHVCFKLIYWFVFWCWFEIQHGCQGP